MVVVVVGASVVVVVNLGRDPSTPPFALILSTDASTFLAITASSPFTLYHTLVLLSNAF